MYHIFVYDDCVNKLFDYYTSVLPVIGDVYANLSTHACPGHYRVIKRILHTDADFKETLSIWVVKTSAQIA